MYPPARNRLSVTHSGVQTLARSMEPWPAPPPASGVIGGIDFPKLLGASVGLSVYAAIAWGFVSVAMLILGF